MAVSQILPARNGGRGTGLRSGVVEGQGPTRSACGYRPSTSLRLVPLPIADGEER
jgi:hypothetical protein